MKLIYISHLRFPSERTHSTFALKTCEGFAREGVDVELWIPRRRNPAFRGVDPFRYHRIEKNFIIRRLPAFDVVAIAGKFGNAILTASFSVSVLVYAVSRRLLRRAIFYGHDPYDMAALLFVRPRMYVEFHEMYDSFRRNSRFARWIFSRMAGVITTNRFKVDMVHNELDISRGRILHQPNAVDASAFEVNLDTLAARKSIHFDGRSPDFDGQTVILYTGHLFDWKGADVLFDAHRFLAGDETVYFVGGTKSDVEKFKARSEREGAKNIVMVGERPHGEIPAWLRAADVLVLPHSGKFDIARFEASPVKLFEYMASGRPIVAADLPSIREIVDESMVWFFEPDNPRSLVETIRKALLDREESERKAAKARIEARRYTWTMRSKHIIDFVTRTAQAYENSLR